MEKFFTIKGKTENEDNNLFARFGFTLISINRPANESEEGGIQRIAIAWHENLFRSISSEYRDSVQLNLKFIADKPNAIQCYIILTLYADNTEKLDSLLSNLQHDLTPLFSAEVDDNVSSYLFRPITDIDFLAKANEFSEQQVHTIFFRKPFKINKTAGIAFPKFGHVVEEENGDGLHGEIFPFAGEFSFDSELFRAMLNQKGYTEVDVELKPKALSTAEFELLRQVIKTPSLLKATEISQEETQLYIEELRQFVKSRNNRFIISVVLKTKSRNWEEFLKTSVCRYFFGTNTRIKTEIRNSHSLERYSTKPGIKDLLPFFYSTDNAIEAFRIPLPSIQDIPGITVQNFVFQQVPKNLEKEGILIGKKQTVNGKIEVRLSNHSLARHLYIMGQTGTGKSTLLKTMITDCINKNYGFTVIDPHGDLFTDIMMLIPEGFKEKVQIINPTDLENPLGINPLNFDENNPQAKSLIINELMRAISSLYDMDKVGGPMFETYLKNGLLLIMDTKVRERFGRLTLKDLCKLFYEDDFRRELLKECSDKNTKTFFQKAHESSGEQSFNNVAIYISSKLNRFVDDYYLEPLLTGKKETIDFRKIIDEGKILMVKMDKGKLGTDNTSLLGQIILSNLFMAGMSRTDIEKEQRKPYYIFIDEFQNFMRGDIGTALSEMRKYRISLVLANQTLGQLDNYLVESVMGNVGNMVFFRPGINDYIRMNHYFEPEFTRQDVLKLPNFNCIARLMFDNVPSDPFVFQTVYE